MKDPNPRSQTPRVDLRRKGSNVRAGGIDGDRVGDAALNEPEGQSTDAASDIQQISVREARFLELLQQEPGRRAGPAASKAFEISGGGPLVELAVRCAFVAGATRCHCRDCMRSRRSHEPDAPLPVPPAVKGHASAIGGPRELLGRRIVEHLTRGPVLQIEQPPAAP